MKVLTRDGSSIVIQISANELSQVGVMLQKPRGSGYGYIDVPDEEISSRLERTFDLMPEVFALAAGYDYHRNVLATAVKTLDKMKEQAGSVVGRIRREEPKLPST